MGNKHGREEKGKYRNNNTCPKEPARYDTSWIETIERSYVVVWCDPTIGAPSTANDDKNTLLQLARVLNKKRQLIHTFNEMEPCREFIKNANNICLIVSGQMGTELVPSVHDLYQIDSVFIFCLNKPKYDAWAKQYKKIRGVFTDIKEICEYLKTYFKSQMPADYEQLQFDLITKDLTLPGTNKIDIAFLYPMFSKIILSNLQTVQYEDMINYFRMEFTSEYQTQLINDIENTYSQHNPIWWFTRDRFFQGIINRALQIHDLHTLCLMIPYLKDLENALTDLHKQQIHSSPKTLQLYLSQTISRDDFEKFRLNIGGLICINQFLFANTQRAIALLFVDEELSTPNNARNINVVFEISISKTIDPNTNYANIGPISDFVHEKEYLLSMSSIYRVDKIDEYMKTPLVWSIHLTLIDKNDSLLSNFTRIINAEYLSKEIDLSELSSNIKTKLDLFPSTRKLFEHGLNFHTKQIRPILLHYNMGIIYDALNDYEKALNQYEYAIKSTRTSELHVQQRDNLCLVPFYANLALTYQQSNRRKEAFEHGFRTLEILNKDGTNSIFRNELTASSHYNLGLILDLQGEPDQAKPHYELALKYRQEYLPNNHPDVISLQQTISSASSQQVLLHASAKSSNANQNIIILRFGVDLPDKTIPSTYEIQSADNAMKFIADILSIKDKIIYAIISEEKSRSIIPLIHKHYCLEKIYVYKSTVTPTFSDLSSTFEKICGYYTNINKLLEQLIYDIKITKEESFHWNRSFNLFTMLYTQQLENKSSIIERSSDVPCNVLIIIFHCCGQTHIPLKEKLAPFHEFTNTEECVHLIKQETQSEIFLIISGEMIPSEMFFIWSSPQIHAIYLLNNDKIKRRKVRGLYDEVKELLLQLYEDIIFYQEQHFHIARIDICSRIDPKKIDIKQLNNEQINFLKMQLFIDTLPATPILELNREDFLQISHLLFPNRARKTVDYLNQLQAEDYHMKNFDEDLKLFRIVSKLYKMNSLNEMFLIQKPLMNIQKHVCESQAISTSVTVYVTRLISKDTLNILRSNIGNYIGIGILVLATKSILTARSIVRQALNNGIVSVLFEIEVTRDTYLLNVNNNRVIFRLNPVFSLKSINRAPDCTNYIKIKCVDKEFSLIKQQLEFDIDLKLSWLTYGNYLYILEGFEESEAYFKYLLDKLSAQQIYQLAIYNNMGLLYAKKYEETDEPGDKAKYLNMSKKAYTNILKNAKLDESNTSIKTDEHQSCMKTSDINIIPINTTVNYSTAVGNMADLYYKANKYEEAMKSYIEALALSVDQQFSCYCQKMILIIKEHLKKEEKKTYI